MIVVSSAMLTMMRLVNSHGVDTSAAFGATQQLWTYVQMPAMALGAAVSGMAAQNIGAGRWDRVDQITRMGAIFAIVMTGALVLLVMLAGRQVLGLFLDNASGAIAIGVHITNLATWGFLAFGVTMVLFGTVRANGQVVWPVIILFISMYPLLRANPGKPGPCPSRAPASPAHDPSHRTLPFLPLENAPPRLSEPGRAVAAWSVWVLRLGPFG